MVQAPDPPRVTVTAVEVSNEYCRDIMVTCVEGGSNYWASFQNVMRDEELDIHSLEVTEHEEPAVKPGWHKIGVEEIRKAVALVSRSDFKIAARIKQSILNDDNDAESADVVLQAAVFGTVIYG